MALKIMPHGRLQEWVAQHWTEAHQLFPDRPDALLGYDEAALVLSGGFDELRFADRTVAAAV
jgi:hypothetical protein